MATIAGRILPNGKHISIALTVIYGVGRPRALIICNDSGIDPSTKVKDLLEPELEKIRAIVSTFMIEGDLRRQIAMNIKKLMDMGCYRGIRHRRGPPLRGQRTQTNARTRKGRAKSAKKKS